MSAVDHGHDPDRKAKKERGILTRIERGPDARFEGRDRLNAALYIRRLFDSARERYQRQEIQRRIGKRVGRGGFKIDKWMLRKGVERIDAFLVNHYDKRPEPQKKRSTYLAIVEQLAALIDEDPIRHKIELLKQTTHWVRAKCAAPAPLSEIEPAQRLADLLHDCARSVAKRGDLAAIFTAAHRHQLGWRLADGPAAVEIPPGGDEGVFDLKVPATRLYLMQLTHDVLPPYPTLPIARIPFGRLDAELLFEENPRPTPAFEGLGFEEDTHQPLFAYRKEQVAAVAYWELALCVAPVTPFGDIGAVLMETPCVYLWSALTGTLPHRILNAPDFEALEPRGPRFGRGHRKLCQVKTEDGWRRIMSPPDTDLTAMAMYYSDDGVENVIREDLPHLNIPHIAFHPVDAYHVHGLLADPWTKRFGFDIEMPNIALVGLDSSPPARIWHSRTDSVARHLESALLSGEIEAGMLTWMKAYRTALEQFEARWEEEGLAAERRLRARWRSAEEKSDAD